MILSTPFQQGDLNGNNQLVVTHNLNTSVIAPVYIDNTGINQTTVGIFALGDENGNDTLNKCTLSLNSTIIGIHILELVYVSSIEQLDGKKLFEQSTIPSASPSLNDRLALGRFGIPAYNMTLSSLISNLGTWLGSLFLKKADNLAGLNNTAALNNLGAPSLAYVNNQLTQKAGIYQTNSGAALGTANALEYTPQTNYNPATKKYVDDNNPLLCVGYISNHTGNNPSVTIVHSNSNLTPTFSCTRLGEGFYEINHNLGGNYVSINEALYDGGSTIYPYYVSKSKDEENRFFVFCAAPASASGKDVPFKFTLLRFV